MFTSWFHASGPCLGESFNVSVPGSRRRQKKGEVKRLEIQVEVGLWTWAKGIFIFKWVQPTIDLFFGYDD